MDRVPLTAGLQVRAVSKRFGARPVLDGVSFGIRPGEVLGLIGPNGAGKTTLLECLAGTVCPDAGELSENGRPIPLGARRNALFYVPDGIAPWADQRVCRVLDFFGRLFGRAAGQTRAWLEALGLSSLLESDVRSLSKGERKRFLLLLGFVAPQPVLLLDEPFDGLDLRQAREVATLLRTVASGGRSLVLSIHQLPEAESLCDRLVLLDAGRVVGEGDLAALRARAGLSAGGLTDVFLALT